MSTNITLDTYLKFHEELASDALRGDVVDGTFVPKSFRANWPEDFVRMKAIVGAMTTEEKLKPNSISVSRMQTIARHAGTSVDEIQSLVNYFNAFHAEMRIVTERLEEMTFWQRIKLLLGFDEFARR